SVGRVVVRAAVATELAVFPARNRDVHPGPVAMHAAHLVLIRHPAALSDDGPEAEAEAPSAAIATPLATAIFVPSIVAATVAIACAGGEGKGEEGERGDGGE